MLSADSLKKIYSRVEDNMLTKQAFETAYMAHQGQHRKLPDAEGNKIPYILHPLEVAFNLAQFEGVGVIREVFAPQYLAAALLHDVVEDTPYNVIDLYYEGFPKSTIVAVEDLTKFESENYDRQEKLDMYCKQLSEASYFAQMIKAADILTNAEDIEGGSYAWIYRFTSEKIQMLISLTSIDRAIYLLVRKKLDDLRNQVT